MLRKEKCDGQKYTSFRVMQMHLIEHHACCTMKQVCSTYINWIHNLKAQCLIDLINCWG